MTTDKTLEQFLEYYPQKIMSLSNLKFFLKNQKSIVFGIGCLEDLLPYRFRRKTLNQCVPMPFIVDGFITKGYRDFLTIRTTLDEIGSPQIIIWNRLFNSLKMFQSIHPRKDWSLYGIK